MADAILDVVAQLCEGAIVSLRLEDGIVAKAAIPPFLRGDLAADNAFKQMFLAFPNQGNSCPELRLSLRHALQFVQQLAHIGL